MAYVSYSRGYRAGAYNNGFVTKTIQLSSVNPEFVDNYEGGIKATLFDHKLRFALDGFYMQFRNEQLDAAPAVPAGTPSLCCTTINAGRSRIFGAELNGSALLTDRFSVNFEGNVLNAKFQNFQYSTTVNYAGADLGYAPKYKVVISPEYHLPAGTGYFFLAPDFTFSGESRLSTTPNTYKLDIQKPYQMIDGQFGYRWGNGFSVFAWMKDITDKRVLTRFTGGYGYDELFYTPPRTFGVTVTGRY